MSKRFNRTQRNYMIIGLCAILLIMAVGYAAFSSQLKISGTSNITSSFLVKITNIEVSNIVGGAQDKEGVTTHTDDTATFGTTLQSPGDSITYDITIENQGTIDAVLKTINKTDASNSAIIFETSGVSEGDELLHGEMATMQVTVTYNPNVTSQPSNLNSTLKVTLDYAQKGTEVVPGSNNILLGGQEVKVVDSGDGLYADEYESGRYIYRGSNPDNYIMFNDELWRIIAKETDGTYKIIRNDLLKIEYWDLNGGVYGSNDWSRPSDLNEFLNNDYYNKLAQSTKSEIFLNHIWNVGFVLNNNDLEQQIQSEKRNQYEANIGLINVSDYLKANINIEQCGTIQLNNKNYLECRNTNWLWKGNNFWTISPAEETSYIVFYITISGNIYMNGVTDNDNYVIPVVFLKSDITLNGNGTETDPFTIN